MGESEGESEEDEDEDEDEGEGEGDAKTWTTGSDKESRMVGNRRLMSKTFRRGCGRGRGACVCVSVVDIPFEFVGKIASAGSVAKASDVQGSTASRHYRKASKWRSVGGV